ncbi:MAG: hypothetical protein ISP01_04320 [Methanobrevibacter arboriphilus]|uniref:Uncharacterized protein n=1 Tax=Methanobrevibacter arboriphilus TaxID=39441 RepID=A0A843AM52_METAZ|nr:hypothetical protein [Methanobrevibacter arboriphilus]MBF4468608.1 hypothetical protein [Methanobrevibacter arboriphilus]
MHPAAKIPHITKTIQQLTGTSGNGVSLYAYSDNNTSYKQDNAASQEHHEVFICLHPAAKIPHITKTIQQLTGTYDGVYLGAYSDNNTTYNQDYTTIHRNIRQWCWSGCIQQQKYHI